MGLFGNKSETLTEQVFTESVGKVDEENCIIEGVKFLGRISKNGREYSDQALQDAARLYAGCEININHPQRGQERRARDLQESWAKPLNLRVVPGDGVYGDLSYLGTHNETPVILERIKRGFGIGLSHNADGRMVRKDGRNIVEGLTKARSIDLVPNPATNQSLFESEDEKVETTVKAICQQNKNKHPQLTALLEMVGDDPAVGDVPVEVAPEMNADDQIAAAFKAAVAAVLDDTALDMAGKMSKIKELLKAQDKLEGGSEKPAEETPAEEEETTTESTIEQLTKSVTTLTEQVSSMKRESTLSRVLAKYNMSKERIGTDRYSLLESQADESAMEKLISTWPPALRGGTLSNVQPQVLIESQTTHTAPQKADDLIGFLRGR